METDQDGGGIFDRIFPYGVAELRVYALHVTKQIPQIINIMDEVDQHRAAPRFPAPGNIEITGRLQGGPERIHGRDRPQLAVFLKALGRFDIRIESAMMTDEHFDPRLFSGIDQIVSGSGI